MKKIILCLTLLISLFSLSAQDISQEEVNKSLEEGVVSFVKSIKAAAGSDIENGFDEFKIKLLGASNTTTIPEEGNNLLSIAHTLIVEKATDEEIVNKGLNAFKVATKYVLENEAKNPTPAKNLQNGANALFGGDMTSFKGFEASEAGKALAGGGCGSYHSCAHWYNFGCHLHNAGVWICNHAYLLMGIYYIIGIIGKI